MTLLAESPGELQLRHRTACREDCPAEVSAEQVMRFGTPVGYVAGVVECAHPLCPLTGTWSAA